MSAPDNVSLICNVTIIDPEAGAAIPAQDIVISGGRIELLRDTHPAQDPSAIDGTGLFAIPGLIDTHVHALGIYSEQNPGLFDMGWIRRQQEKNFAAFLRSGVTTVRDLGAPLGMIKGFAKRARAWDILAPRILFSGPIISTAGGYPDFTAETPWLVEAMTGPLRVDLRSRAHARRTVRSLARAGVHCIKVMYQSVRYDNEHTALPVPPLDFIRALVDAAHAHNLPVAAHCCYSFDLEKLLDAPIDSWEHLSIDAPLSANVVRRVADKGVSVTTTLMTYGILDHHARLDQHRRAHRYDFEPKPRRLLRRACLAMASGDYDLGYVGSDAVETGSRHMRHNLALLQEAGVPISYGTDSGGAITPCGCPHWEFSDMKCAGMSNAQALRAATTTAATVLRRRWKSPLCCTGCGCGSRFPRR